MSRVVDNNGVVLDDFLEEFLPRLSDLMNGIAVMNLDPVDLRLAHEVIATEMAAEFTDLMVGEFEEGVDFSDTEDESDAEETDENGTGEEQEK
jgi:hypothetical protein